VDPGYASQRGSTPSLIFRYKLRAAVVVDLLRQYLKPLTPLKLLDMGCADGRTLMAIRDGLGEGDYTGVEYNRELLLASPLTLSDIKLMEGDASSLPSEIEDNSYGAVTALALLEHLRDPLSAVREAHRCLRPGGIFIATCPVPFWDRLSTRLGMLNETGHETDMDKSALLRVVNEAGLEALEYKRFMWAPAGFLPYLRFSIDPVFALKTDDLIRKLRVLDFSFVNQSIAARKPY